MKRNEFLLELSYELEGLPQKVRSDMLHDYDDHFASGLAQGRTEEEIAESLGDPHVLGRELRSQYTGEYGQPPPPPPPYPERPIYPERPVYPERPMYPERPPFSIMRSLWMTFVMGMFNLIFILGPYIGLLGILVGFWAAALGLGVAGIATAAASVFPFLGSIHLFVAGSGLSFITMISGAVVCSSLGILFGMGCWYTTKWMFRWTVRYISWNFKVIIGRRY